MTLMIEVINSGDKTQTEHSSKHDDDEGYNFENELRGEDFPYHEVTAVPARTSHTCEKLKEKKKFKIISLFRQRRSDNQMNFEFIDGIDKMIITLRP